MLFLVYLKSTILTGAVEEEKHSLCTPEKRVTYDADSERFRAGVDVDAQVVSLDRQ